MTDGRLLYLGLLPSAYQDSVKTRGRDHPMTKLYWMLLLQEAKMPLDTPQHAGGISPQSTEGR